MRQKIVLSPSLDGTDYLKALAGLNVDPKLTFGVRYFTDIELAKYMMQCSGVICDKTFINNTHLAGKLYNIVKSVDYFSKSSFTDVFNLIKSINELRKCISCNEKEEIKKLLDVKTFKRKNVAIIEVFNKWMDLLDKESLVDEIGLIRYAIDKCDSITNIEFIKYKQFEYTNLSSELLNKAAGKEVELSDLFEDKKPNINTYTKAYGQNSEIEDVLAYIYKNNIKFDECVIAASDVNTYGKILSNYQAVLKFPLVVSNGQQISDTNVGRLFETICEWNSNHNHLDYLVELVNSREFNLEQFKLDIGYGDVTANDINFDLALSHHDAFSFDLIIKTVGDLKLGLDDLEKNFQRVDNYQNLVLEKLKSNPNDSFVKRDRLILDYVKKINEIFANGIIYFLDRYRVEDDANKAVETNALSKYQTVLALSETYKIPSKEAVKFLSGVIAGSRKPQPRALYLTSIDKSLSYLRKHLFVVGLDSKAFPGKVSEDPTILDQDYDIYGISRASERQMNNNKNLYKDLIGLASSLGVDIHLSYAYYNSETAKEQNASSVLFETYQLENGDNKTVNDFNNEFDIKNQDKYRLAGFFENNLFPLSILGQKAKKGVIVESHTVEQSTTENVDASSLISGRGLSYSAIEKYLECPYQFFLNSILHIDQETPTDIYQIIPANELGSIAHEIMEEFDLSMSKKEFLDLSKKKFDEYLIAHPSDNSQGVKQASKEFLEMMDNCYELEKKENSPSVLREEDVFTKHIPSGLRIHGFPDKVARLSDGTFRVVDYKTGNSIRHKVDDPDTVLQGAIYAYILQNGKNKLNYYGSKQIKVSEFVFRYLKHNTNISSYDKGHNIQEYLDRLDQVLCNIAESLKTGTFKPNNKKCATCFYKSVCGGKK